MAQLTITASEDFSDGNPALAPDITSILFNTTGTAIAIFGSDQFGPGLISNSVAVTGDSFNNIIRVSLTAAGAFSAAGWSFTNWSANDRVILAGSAGADVLTGTAFNDTFGGDGGADSLSGDAGDDLFVYSAGEIVAGEVIDGGIGVDALQLLTGGTFDFSVASIIGIESASFINTGVAVTFADTQLRAGAIAAIEGNVPASFTQSITVNGSSVDLSGVTFSNWGGAGQTITITGTSGSDNLTGSSQKDIFAGSAGNDTVSGGGGTDTADYSSATQAVVVDLPGHIAIGSQIGTDTLSSIENVKTGSGNDAVAGDGATNVLDGGTGTDTVSYYLVTSGVVLDLAGQTGVDGTSTDTLLNFENANGTAYNDAISGTAAANVLNGLGGIDTISYYLSTQSLVIDLAGNVAIQGGITDTILNFENVNVSAYNDVVSGNAAANVLNGLGGIDTISYYASAQAVAVNLSAGTGVSGGVTDTLLNFENVNGSSHADTLIGNGGINLLNGLGGTDTLTGGGGFDTFEFRTGQANGDVITDFTGNGAAAGDAIRLAGFGTAAQGATFTQLDATQWQIHSGLDGHNEIVSLSNGAIVHGSDFFFV